MSSQAPTDKVTSTASVDDIRAAVEVWDKRAEEGRDKTSRFAVWVTCLSPVAVLALAIQEIGSPDRILAIGLIAFELVLLACALAVGYVQLGPKPDRWVNLRLRTEVLRREIFLVNARVGPYLLEEEPSHEIARRLRTIQEEESAPIKLLLLGNQDGSWRDDLEDNAGGARPADHDWAAFAKDYLDSRVAHQQNYYRAESHRREHRHEAFELWAKVALILAVVISAIHLTLLLAGSSESEEVRKAIAIAALALPPIGAAILGWQSFFQARRISLMFERQAEALAGVVDELMRLHERLTKQPGDGKAILAFKRIVLRTEELLATEQSQWLILMQSWSPAA